MCAEVLAAAGLAVTVYEHMPSVGRKLLLAGRSGLNITHSEPIERLLSRYGASRGALAGAIDGFGPAELRSWCASLGEPTFVGSTGQVFPASLRATPLLRAWLSHLSSVGVRIEVRHRWLGWAESRDGKADPRRSRFSVQDGSAVEVANDVALLALGGASWPRVGSDGTWVDVLRRADVKVNDLRPANCGMRVEWTQHFEQRFAGVPLKNIAIDVGGLAIRGDAMITRYGIEGGPVYAHSAVLRDAIARDGECTMTIDLHPDLAVDQLIERLIARRPKDSVNNFLRRTLDLAPVSISLLREVTGNRVPNDPTILARLVKAVPLTVESTMPIERAISSAGGISLDEIDGSFMLRRLPGTFVAGEMLDWEAPTGGYLLQATFSTAVAAARGAIAWLATRR
jgi:uncharacterized flavoprotein (TIGR03862 family)